MQPDEDDHRRRAVVVQATQEAAERGLVRNEQEAIVRSGRGGHVDGGEGYPSDDLKYERK